MWLFWPLITEKLFVLRRNRIFRVLTACIWFTCKSPVENKHRLLFQAHDDLTHLHSLWMISPTFSSCTNMKSDFLYLSKNFTSMTYNIALERTKVILIPPSSVNLMKSISSFSDSFWLLLLLLLPPKVGPYNNLAASVLCNVHKI